MFSALLIPLVALVIGCAAFIIDRIFNFDAKDIENEERHTQELEQRLKKLEREIAAIRQEEERRHPPHAAHNAMHAPT